MEVNAISSVPFLRLVSLVVSGNNVRERLQQYTVYSGTKSVHITVYYNALHLSGRAHRLNDEGGERLHGPSLPYP